MNSLRWDCHMHSSFSGDSETPMADMIEQAVSLGLSGITFTEHLDLDYPPIPDDVDFSLDIAAYRQCLFSNQEKYKREIDLRYGVELGLQPHLSGQLHELLKNEPFDFVIGSSHVAHRRDPYYPEFFEGRREEDAYREYFESILENLLAFSEMDVYGHLDYIVRYGPEKNRNFSCSQYQDILDEILRTLVQKGVGIELNSSGFHYGLGEPNPCTEIIRRYREAGGEIITIGADAHTPERIAFAFDRAEAVLQNCGFTYYTVFHDRKPEFIKIG